MGDGWGADGADRWDGRLGIALGEQGWLEAAASGEAEQVIVHQFLILIVWQILRAVREMIDVLLTNVEDKEK